jgi:hypothetical protein
MQQKGQKLNMFWLFFGLFHETKDKFLWFVLFCFWVSNMYQKNETHIPVSKQTEKKIVNRTHTVDRHA